MLYSSSGFGLLLTASCSSIVYTGNLAKNTAQLSGWDIIVHGLADAGRVDGSYYGDQYYNLHIEARNTGSLVSMFFFGGKDLEEKNFSFRLHNNRKVLQAYRASPESFDKEEYLRKSPTVFVKLRAVDPLLRVQEKFIKYRSYAEETLNYRARPNELFAVGMIRQKLFFGCNNGNNTGWLRPGQSEMCKQQFSAPDGTIPVSVMYRDDKFGAFELLLEPR
ncbi:MAG: hypothetical protein NXI24_10805 [bacterium]|nr:hypothetical protein [bacterium]